MNGIGSGETSATGLGFHHVAMRVRDFERSVNFYSRGMGFSSVQEWKSNDTRTALIEIGGGAYLEIFERKAALSLAGGAPFPVGSDAALLHFALRTNNCDATLELARRAGGDVTVEPKDVEFPGNPVVRARIAFFKGPDGETVELFEDHTER